MCELSFLLQFFSVPKNKLVEQGLMWRNQSNLVGLSSEPVSLTEIRSVAIINHRLRCSLSLSLSLMVDQENRHVRLRSCDTIKCNELARIISLKKYYYHRGLSSHSTVPHRRPCLLKSVA